MILYERWMTTETLLNEQFRAIRLFQARWRKSEDKRICLTYCKDEEPSFYAPAVELDACFWVMAPSFRSPSIYTFCRWSAAYIENGTVNFFISHSHIETESWIQIPRTEVKFLFRYLQCLLRSLIKRNSLIQMFVFRQIIAKHCWLHVRLYGPSENFSQNSQSSCCCAT